MSTGSSAAAAVNGLCLGVCACGRELTEFELEIVGVCAPCKADRVRNTILFARWTRQEAATVRPPALLPGACEF